MTVREQEISKRIDSLELTDLLNVASNKISEKLLEDLLFGSKVLTQDGEKEVLMKAVESRMLDYLQKLEEQQATKQSEDSSNFMRNLTVNRETGQFKMSDTKLVKISNEESVKYELVSDLTNKEDFMNTHFLDGIGGLEWKNSVISKELVAKMDQQISKKYAPLTRIAAFAQFSASHPEEYRQTLDKMLAADAQGSGAIDTFFDTLNSKFEEIDRLWLHDENDKLEAIKKNISAVPASANKKIESRASTIWRQQKAAVLTGIRLRIDKAK